MMDKVSVPPGATDALHEYRKRFSLISNAVAVRQLISWSIESKSSPCAYGYYLSKQQLPAKLFDRVSARLTADIYKEVLAFSIARKIGVWVGATDLCCHALHVFTVYPENYSLPKMFKYNYTTEELLFDVYKIGQPKKNHSKTI